jgi:purine-binding chemotaxis protein CheW
VSTGWSRDRLIGFRVGETRAALPLSLVSQVTDRPPMLRVPGSHPYVRGVALRDGVAVPVYDLGLFEPLWRDRGSRRSGPRPAAAHLIVCDWGDTELGLLGDQVDLIPESQDPTPGPVSPHPAGAISERYVKTILRVEGESFALLNADRLFASLGVPAAEPRGRRQPGEDDPAGG